jgi:alginate O-acetyltransferase complex protein AlgI
MNVPSLQFLAFAALAVALYNLGKPRTWRGIVLLVLNLVFLATFANSWSHFLPLVGFLGLGFVGLRLAQTRRAGLRLWPLVLSIVFVFVWLKKYTFLPSFMLLQNPYTTIGLSYIFFRVLHLVIDAAEGSLPDRLSLASYLNYTLNFTTLVAGPIQRFEGFAATQNTEERPALTIFDVGRACERIVLGFFKVAPVSVLLIWLQKHSIALLATTTNQYDRVLVAAAIAVTYPFYLYCNFSGYTDFVIGVAAFLRMRLPENFNRPFSSLNFIDFWNRWHITLSSWLKTYVYTPLVKTLMSRYPSARLEPFLGVIGFFVTFFLIGVWHGQTSVFVFFGFLQGLGVSMNRLYQVLMAQWFGRKGYRNLAANALYRAFARGFTFTWFTFTLLWFWSDWKQLGYFAGTIGVPTLCAIWLLILLGATIVLSGYEAVRTWALSLTRNGNPILYSRYLRTAWSTALLTIVLVTLLVSTGPAPEVVYKVF